MNISIDYTHHFEVKFKRYKKKFKSIESDLKSFIDGFADCKSVHLGNGFHKYRLAIKSKNTGKSGGFRVISFEILIAENEKKTTLITIYDKSEMDNISQNEINEILKKEGLI